MFHLFGAIEEEDAIAADAYAHQIPLSGGADTRGIYYPGTDTLYVGRDDVAWDSVTFEEPIIVDDEFTEEQFGVPIDETIPTDLIEYFGVSDAVTFNHEFGHQVVSARTAPVSVPFYSAFRATQLLAWQLNEGEPSRSQFVEMLARQLEIESYVQFTRPIQEAMAWVNGSYLSDDETTERLAARIADIDSVLEDTGTRLVPPPYRHPSRQSKREQAMWEQFQLSYERAILACVHRLCRSFPDGAVTTHFISAAIPAVSSRFSLLDTDGQPSPQELQVTSDETLSEFLATAASTLENVVMLSRVVQDVHQFDALGKALHSSLHATEHPEAVSEHLRRKTGFDEADDIQTAARGMNRTNLPTILFIEQPARNSIQTVLSGVSGRRNHMILSLFRRSLVSSYRHDVNLFASPPVRDLLTTVGAYRENDADQVPDAALMVDKTERLYQQARTDDIRHRWTELLEATLGSDSRSRTSSAFAPGTSERADFEALLSYAPDGSPDALDEHFDVPTAQTDGWLYRAWGDLLTGQFRRAPSTPDAVALDALDRHLRQFALRRPNPNFEYARGYGNALGTLYRSHYDTASRTDFEEWVERYTTHLVERLSYVRSTSQRRKLLTKAFISGAGEIFATRAADPDRRSTWSLIRRLKETCESVADELDIRWHPLLGPHFPIEGVLWAFVYLYR